MHFERTNLPADVVEIFFSDVYFYAASTTCNVRGRSLYVGCGVTRDAAIEEMRQEALTAGPGSLSPAMPKPALAAVKVEGVVPLSDSQRQALARNLQRLRRERKASQMEVARALGFEKSHAAVSRLERGTLSHVATVQLRHLADFFATSADALLQVTA